MVLSMLRKAAILLCCMLVMQCRSDTVTDGESEAAARVILYKVSPVKLQVVVNTVKCQNILITVSKLMV